jgi:hypothetical protein
LNIQVHLWTKSFQSLYYKIIQNSTPKLTNCYFCGLEKKFRWWVVVTSQQFHYILKFFWSKSWPKLYGYRPIESKCRLRQDIFISTGFRRFATSLLTSLSVLMDQVKTNHISKGRRNCTYIMSWKYFEFYIFSFWSYLKNIILVPRHISTAYRQGRFLC